MLDSAREIMQVEELSESQKEEKKSKEELVIETNKHMTKIKP